MDGEKQITQNQHANMVITEYFNVIEASIGRLMGETKNGSIKKGYVNVMNEIQLHRKRWKRQFESIESDNAQLAKKEQLQKA